MTKRSKKKTPSNLTAQSVTVPEAQSSNSPRGPAGSLSISTAAALTGLNSPQPPSKGLEDLDHCDDENTPLTNNTNDKATKSGTKKQHQLATKKASVSPSSSWTTNARETSAASGVWAWLTASHVISELQLEHVKESRVQKAMHGRKQAELFGAPEQEPLMQRNEHKSRDKDKEELEKKAMCSWDRAKMQQVFDLTGRDWVALSVLTVATLGVRLWRISWPDEVALDEVHMGRHINGYINNEFSFDPQPPLGKLLLAGVSSFAGYNGSFVFDEIGDAFPGWMPYVSLRLVMALMGTMCSPMAYVTLKATGQSAPAALVAATLVAFDNALTANNRLFLLDAPLMFFVAATFMSWNMFVKQSPRPFTSIWWAWLLATGISMTGAMSTKLAGVFTVAVVGLLSSANLWRLAREDSTNAKIWTKHAGARVFSLILLPSILYLILFHLHFSLHLYQSDIRHSPQAEHELDLLPRAFRHSLRRKYFATEEERHDYEDEEIWSDVVFGSVIQLQSEFDNPGSFLHSFYKGLPTGSGQQQVAGYSYGDLNTHWIVIRAATDEHEKEEIPSRIQYLKNSDILRLRHVPTRKCLHSHEERSIGDRHNLELCEVTAYGSAESDGDKNDWWEVEVIDEATQTKQPRSNKNKVKALESLIQLRHYSLGCYLAVADGLLPDLWGEGRREIVCRKGASANAKSTWRITMNDHDNLPMDTELASYPVMTFWKKFVQTHKLMLNNPDLNVQAQKYQPSASRPLHWPIAQSIIPAWAGYKRQLTIVANPVVWWTGTLGVLTFMVAKALFALREKRGYFETERVTEFKNYHLNDAAVYFLGWVAYYVPFVYIGRTLFMHHYFPSLYLSILLASSVFSGLVGFLPRTARFILLLAFLFLTISIFIRLSPLSYASAMTREHCESLAPMVHGLDCSHAPPASARPALLSDLKAQARHDKANFKKAIHTPTTSAAITVDTQLAPKQQQQDGPPIPASAPGAPPIDFLTTASQDAWSRSQQSVRNRDAHLPAQGAWGAQVRTTRPEPKVKAPILPMHFPLANETLPMEGVFLTPYQRPPQRWVLDLEEEEREEEEARLKEEEERRRAQEEPSDGEEEVSHATQDQGDLTYNNDGSNHYYHRRDNSAPWVPERGDNEKQIDRLLEEYTARNRAERGVRVAVAQAPSEDAQGQPVQDQGKEAKNRGGGGGSQNTMGQVPGQSSDRLGYAEREKMMANAAGLAPQVSAKRRTEASGLLGQDAKDKHRRPSEAMSQVRPGNKALDAFEVRGVSLGETGRASISESMADDFWAREWAETEALVPSEHGEEEEEEGEEEEMMQKPKAKKTADYAGESQKVDEDDDVEYEIRGPPIHVGSPGELEKVLQQLQAEGVRAEVVRGSITQTIEPLAPPVEDDAEPSDEYGDDGSYEDEQEYISETYDGEGEDDDDDNAPRPPPIAVKNAEELASVLDQLAAEGIRAEVVRGTATRYVEPPSVTGDAEE